MRLEVFLEEMPPVLGISEVALCLSWVSQIQQWYLLVLFYLFDALVQGVRRLMSNRLGRSVAFRLLGKQRVLSLLEA